MFYILGGIFVIAMVFSLFSKSKVDSKIARKIGIQRAEAILAREEELNRVPSGLSGDRQGRPVTPDSRDVDVTVTDPEKEYYISLEGETSYPEKFPVGTKILKNHIQRKVLYPDGKGLFRDSVVRATFHDENWAEAWFLEFSDKAYREPFVCFEEGVIDCESFEGLSGEDKLKIAGMFSVCLEKTGLANFTEYDYADYFSNEDEYLEKISSQ